MAQKTKTTSAPKQATKCVHNRNAYKMEVFSNGQVFVFPPKSTTVVPDFVTIPAGRGLSIR